MNHGEFTVDRDLWWLKGLGATGAGNATTSSRASSQDPVSLSEGTDLKVFVRLVVLFFLSEVEIRSNKSCLYTDVTFKCLSFSF